MRVPDVGGDYRAYGDSDCDGYPNSDPNSNGHCDSVMAVSDTNAGPRFSDLTAQPDPEGALGTAPPEPTGGVMSNDRAKEAILKSPLQQARVRVELSKGRIQKLAMQLKQARNAI